MLEENLSPRDKDISAEPCDKSDKNADGTEETKEGDSVSCAGFGLGQKTLRPGMLSEDSHPPIPDAFPPVMPLDDLCVRSVTPGDLAHLDCCTPRTVGTEVAPESDLGCSINKKKNAKLLQKVVI